MNVADTVTAVAEIKDLPPSPTGGKPVYPYELFVFFRFIDLNTIIRFCLIIYKLDP